MKSKSLVLSLLFSFFAFFCVQAFSPGPQGGVSQSFGKIKYPNIFMHLTTNGDGTGTQNAIGNYSSAATQFYYYNSTQNEYHDIHRMLVKVRDTGAFDVQDYGNGIALSNGIQVKHFASDGTTELQDFINGDGIDSNGDWGEYCYDADVKTWGTGDEFLLVRWTFANSGSPVRLYPGERLSVVLNDDFTGLVDQEFVIQGTKIQPR